jgi:hypothetical protein
LTEIAGSSSLIKLATRLAFTSFFAWVDFFSSYSSELDERAACFFACIIFIVFETGISLSLDEFEFFDILLPFAGSLTSWSELNGVSMTFLVLDSLLTYVLEIADKRTFFDAEEFLSTPLTSVLCFFSLKSS